MPAQKPPRPPQAWHLRSQSLAADSRAALNFAAFLRKVAAIKPSSRARLAALALAIAGVVSPVSVPADGIRGTPEAVAAADAANGSFRFEYLGATLTEGPLATPE
jgi:hypothetical protein